MQRRLSISFESDDDRSYDCLYRRLLRHEAIQVLPKQWIVLTELTADELRRDLQAYIDPADRILITQVASMSSRNLIDADRLGRGAA